MRWNLDSSARSARDRDRLRREALSERQGWKLHRVWCMDWYQRPAEQLDRVVAVIESEKKRVTADSEAEVDRSAVSAIERDDNNSGSADISHSDTGAYVEASVTRPPDAFDLVDTPIPMLAAMIAEIWMYKGLFIRMK